jgi:hypothetical protein
MLSNLVGKYCTQSQDRYRVPTIVPPRAIGLASSTRLNQRGFIFDLGAIKASLREAEDQVARTNPELKFTRDQVDRDTVDYMVSGYAFVEELITREIDLFSLGQLRLFLELNAIVLCGRDGQMRAEAIAHLAATEKHFFDNIDGGIRDVIEWHALHAGESAWVRAAGVYIRILSQPELFIEGNHRTGALVMSYLLARDGYPPFVLTVANSKLFFDYSTRFTAKRKVGLALRWQMFWLKRQFASFLCSQANAKFLHESLR